MHELQRRPDARLPIAPPYSPRVARPAVYDPRVRSVIEVPELPTESSRSLGIMMAVGVSACGYGGFIGLQAMRDVLVWMTATNERVSGEAFSTGMFNAVRMICVLAFGAYLVYLAGIRLLDADDGASGDTAATPAAR